MKKTICLLLSVAIMPTGLADKAKCGYRRPQIKTTHISPWTKMDLKLFRVMAMYEYYYKSGKLTKEEWYAKLDRHSEGQGILVSVCSYCDMITGIKPGKGMHGISHGMCCDCLMKEYARYELTPDPNMPKAREEMNRNAMMFEVYKRSG